MTEYVKALPVRKNLDGCGTVWESELSRRGWNDLPYEQKYGCVVQLYSDNTVDVCFDAIGFTACGVFLDEIDIFKPKKVTHDV